MSDFETVSMGELTDLFNETPILKKAISIKTQSRREIRKINSEAHLKEILPEVVLTGDAWHVLSCGDIDSLSFLRHLSKHENLDYVLLSTWCMGNEDVKELASMLHSGIIKTFDAYVGEIFPSQYSAAHTMICELAKEVGGRVAVFKNHSKIFLCEGVSGHKTVIESSANINTNPRCENTVITADDNLFDYYKSYFDGIKSFNRDFDTK